MAREAEQLPPGPMHESTRAGLLDAAREQRERWGCPRGGKTLDPDLAAEAAYVARLTRTPAAETCPLACIEHASPWTVEVLRAVGLAADWHVPIETSLGRDLTRADLLALSTLKNAQHDAWKSDQKIREEETERERNRPRGRNGAR